MRIFNGKDYYDSALGFGADPSIVFERKNDWMVEEKEVPVTVQLLDVELPKIKLDKPKRLFRSSLKEDKISIDYRYYKSTEYGGPYRSVMVLFCGKVYRGIKQQHFPKDIFYWNEQSFRNGLEKFGFEVLPFKGEQLNIFRPFANDRKAEEFLMDNYASIAIYNPDWYSREKQYWYLDSPTLKDIDFQKVIDPFSAFQELFMWIGSRAEPNPDMENISDKSKIKKHGMDKWSFRKMPEKRP